MPGAKHENTFEVSDYGVNANSPEAVGTTLNHKSAFVRKAYAGKRPDGKTSSTPAHEIGHTLGMEHSEKGIMTPSQNENRNDTSR